MSLKRSWLLKERVVLDQPSEGYRAGLDAVLLAAALRLNKPDERLLEAGCGAGGALFCAANRLSEAHFTGLERDSAMLELTASNIALNNVAGRVSVVLGDVADRSQHLLNGFDHVFSNPPYFRPDAIQAVHPGRQGAYLADVGLEDWLKFMLHTVRPRGRITLIHRAGELARILGFMESRFGEIEIMPIRSRRGMPAKRVIVTGRKGLRRGEVLLHDGLVLFDGPDQPTARAEAIYAGGALSWNQEDLN